MTDGYRQGYGATNTDPALLTWWKAVRSWAYAPHSSASNAAAAKAAGAYAKTKGLS